MDTVSLSTAKEALALAGEKLAANQAANGLPYGILHNLVESDQPLLVAVKEKEEVLALLVRTPPHHLILSAFTTELEPVWTSAIKELAVHDVPSIIGSIPAVEAFQTIWQATHGCQSEVGMEQRIFRADRVIPPRKTSGAPRWAEEEDAALLTEWIEAFAEEALDGVTKEEAAELAERFISKRSVLLWEDDGQAVSMAGAGRPAAGSCAVQHVYTPKEYRGRGYAENVTAALTKELLSRYSFCTLYTDLANPTSNAIYTRIGYEPVADSRVVNFIYR
ncbi:GNAT family N-acetyltransferase [Bacillus daqingensis]|uniref:GNAT family N-acetyltransferase n=1 Tax=Bacillus daqingensis TaxID=872396 RepID=A0ABV9P032_9BACI